MSDKKFPVHVSYDVVLTSEDIDDIMSAALDGGITHWCCRAEVVEDDYYGELASEQISRGGSLRLYDCEEDEVYVLTLEKFLTGFRLWIESGQDLYGAVTKTGVDTGEIDGEMADWIVQFALFGEVVFG